MHRRYNRWHMRFDQPDPYGGSYDKTNPQSFNRYSYVLNDPVNFVDPWGLDAMGALGSTSADEVRIGPGTVTVNVPFSRGSDFQIETDPFEPGQWNDIGGGGGAQQNPRMDTSEGDRILTPGCIEFLNSILAELAKLREPYNRDFSVIFKQVKNQNAFRSVRLPPEVLKKRLGGVNLFLVGDAQLDIEVDERQFNRSDLTAGYIMIHEVFHASPRSGEHYNHFEMATAAYNVMQANPTFKRLLGNTGNNKPPERGTSEAIDWGNAGIFDAAVRIGCPVPPPN